MGNLLTGAERQLMLELARGETLNHAANIAEWPCPTVRAPGAG